MGLDKNTARQVIADGRTALGIEFGSTRIKAVLIGGKDNTLLASGSYEWENQYVNGIWTYDLKSIWHGLQESYGKMAKAVKDEYDVELCHIGTIGFSAMMHGYMAFDKKGELLVPFRTWRNNITGQSSEVLTKLFQYNIPQRWSISHLYQAILNGEDHVSQVDYITTLAGYIHWQLTGEKVIGVGDASGMFPIDSQIKNYNASMIQAFDTLVAPKGFPWELVNILPRILLAGDKAGVLTKEGAKLLDVSGRLLAGIPLCPPEGDAGTGMVATNSVAKRTGNVSAGTSVFAMIVLEKELSRVYTEIDMVSTPSGNPVAMVHSNNCTSDLNAWVMLFKEFADTLGMEINMNSLFETLYKKALEGEADCGGLLSYCYLSGEHITHFQEGRPLFVRTADSRFNLANFMRVHLYTALGALKTGMDILHNEEGVEIDQILGHGGFFKTKDVGTRMMAAAINVPVAVMETAGEGGAFGIALLAEYMTNKEENETLEEYLANKVFSDKKGIQVNPLEEDVAGFNAFIKRYQKGLAIERAAVENLEPV